MEICIWKLTMSVSDDELLKACERFQISHDISTYVYRSFECILQDGPQCGLVALGMYFEMSKNEIHELCETAKQLDLTYNGEILSAEYMCILAKRYTNQKVEVYTGNFASDKIKCFLLNRGVAVVPYDVDANHSPCNKNGHKAHWALICGIIVSDDVYIIARQGKSKYLGIWPIQQMAESNSQLNEFIPPSKYSDLTYKLPTGDLAGPQGLKNKCVLIYE